MDRKHYSVQQRAQRYAQEERMRLVGWIFRDKISIETIALRLGYASQHETDDPTELKVRSERGTDIQQLFPEAIDSCHLL